MCLISIAGKGTEKYSEAFYSAVENGIKSNRDGSGFAYWRHGTSKVVWEKGYMTIHNGADKTLANMWADLLELNLKKEDMLIVHHRISTCGAINEFNCHPFHLSLKKGSSILDVVETSGETTSGVMFHNGGISDYNRENKGYNDTSSFVNAVFREKPEVFQLLKRDKKLFKEAFGKIIHETKLAFLTPKEIILLGDFITDMDGYIHSHYGYRSYSKDKGSSGKTMSLYGSAYGFEDDLINSDFDEDNYYNIKYPKSDHYKRNLLLLPPVAEEKDNPDKYKKFEPVFVEETEIIIPDKTPKLITKNIKEHLDNILNTSSSNSMPIGKVKEILMKNWDENQRYFRQLLLLEPDHCFNFNFILKEKFGMLNSGDVVKCYDFDINAPSCRLNNNDPKIQITVPTSPGKLINNADLFPVITNANVYLTYAQLCALKPGNNAIKYLRNIVKKSTSPRVKIKKPYEMTVSREGIKVYLDIWDIQSRKPNTRVKEDPEPQIPNWAQ